MSPTHCLFFRGILMEILLLHGLYYPGAESGDRALWALLWIYALGAAALFLRGRGRPQSRARSPAWFLADILVVSVALASSRGVSSDFYVAYFLVILASALVRRPAYSFLVGGLSCLIYGWLTLPSLEAALAPSSFLRLSLLLTTTLLSALVTESAAQSQQSLSEEYSRRIAWLERLSLAGRIAASALHELKTPLSTILLTAERARGLAPALADSFHAIETEAERIHLILKDFLDFTSPSELALAPVPLTEMVGESWKKISAGIDPEAIVFTNAVTPDAAVMASRRHLEQVFLNLFDNAIEAMPMGGALTVSAVGRGPWIEVAIVDSGMGISAETMPRLEEPFSSTRLGKGGHGLGLYVIRWIVEKHGGEFHLESPGPRLGTTAVLRLRPKS